jgi:hypothetical protein
VEQFALPNISSSLPPIGANQNLPYFSECSFYAKGLSSLPYLGDIFFNYVVDGSLQKKLYAAEGDNGKKTIILELCKQYQLIGICRNVLAIALLTSTIFLGFANRFCGANCAWMAMIMICGFHPFQIYQNVIEFQKCNASLNKFKQIQTI